MMLLAFFKLFISFSFASEDHIPQFRHKKLRGFDSQAGISTTNLKETSTGFVCNGPPESFTEITDGTEITGNSYACNQFFTKPISMGSNLLHIYHCEFTFIRGSLPTISIDSCSSNGDIIISNCVFSRCTRGCIYLNKVTTETISISQCSFKYCVAFNDKTIIQFNSDSGTIQDCYFCDNEASGSSKGDIIFSPTTIDSNNLVIDGCTFVQSREGKSSNFIYLQEGSKITFKNNYINIWTSGKIFANEITNLEVQTFENNMMYPFNSDNIGTNNLPTNSIIDPGDNLECPIPEGVSIKPGHLFCGDIGLPSENTLLNANSFLQVYYSSFNSLKNVNGDGGAAFIKMPDQPTIDTTHSIKFYHSTFTRCQAQNGCAIYLESSDSDRLFDFNYCTFSDNYFKNPMTKAGGAIYIKSSVSRFKFSNCMFYYNMANDGGAIYYLSEETSSSNNDKNAISLQVTDCCFYNNKYSCSGSSLALIMKSDESPRPIEINKCQFLNGNIEDDPFEVEYEYGGAIYYSLDCKSSNAPSDSSPQVDYSLRVYECTFINNAVSNFGGAICIIIANNEPYKSIEIHKCIFDENYANYATEDYDAHGGGICYILKDTSVSTDNENPSLVVHECNFKNCYAFSDGGSIYILVQNAESSRTIDIYDCTSIYTNKGDTILGELATSSNGGVISYIINSTYDSPSKNNNPPLKVHNCTFSSNIDTFDMSPEMIEQGGIIYISVKNSQQTGKIEIYDCNFSSVYKNAQESYGGSIYYASSTSSSTSESSHTVLSISNCRFSDSEVKNNGGSIYILFSNDESQKQIDITDCTFKNTKSRDNKDAIYIQSNKKTNTIKITDCTFESCMILFNALSTIIESCTFNEINKDNHAILYKSSNAEDTETSFSIEGCNFIQTEATVDSLVYFATRLSSKFSFTNNMINFTDNNSHVLDCVANLEIQEEKDTYWHFENNVIDPNDEVVIKTKNAEKIPAECITGFTCIPSQKNCDENNRCELPTDTDNRNSIELIGKQYSSTTESHGGAIHLTNVALTCKDSSFTDCQALKGGGGGIFIVVKETITITSFVIEKNTFTRCNAKFGGAIYIYNNQETIDFSIKRCIFDSNVASLTAEDDVNSHLFGGSAVYLQTKTGKLIRCTFRKNSGSGVKIYHQEGLEAPENPSTSSLKLNSKDESSIQIKDCFFEANKKSSSSSLFYVHDGKKQFPINIIDCTFVGELPHGSYHIDGESSKKEKMKIKVERCKFESDRKLALNSKLNVMSFDVNSQQFNYKEGAEKVSNNGNQSIQQNKGSGFRLAALTVTAVVAISMVIIIIFKKKKNSQVNTTDSDVNAVEL